MFFLLRTAFWFSLVLLFLPFGPDENGNQVGPIQAFVAASEAVGDIAGFCDRKPQVCETGSAAFHTIAVRAREGARIAYQMLGDEFSEPDPSVHTGSVPPAE
jgi:hypothetical protein